MPLLEAFPDENQVMKYKLTTLPRSTAKMPVISIDTQNYVISQGDTTTISPHTLNYLQSSPATTEGDGYTMTISDIRLLSTFTGTGISSDVANALNVSATIGTDVSATRIGTSFTLTGTTVNTLFGSNTALYATLTITGRNSGARLQVPITISKTGS